MCSNEQIQQGMLRHDLLLQLGFCDKGTSIHKVYRKEIPLLGNVIATMEISLYFPKVEVYVEEPTRKVSFGFKEAASKWDISGASYTNKIASLVNEFLADYYKEEKHLEVEEIWK